MKDEKNDAEWVAISPVKSFNDEHAKVLPSEEKPKNETKDEKS